MTTDLQTFAQLVHEMLEAQDAYKRNREVRDLISANFYQTKVEDAIEDFLHPQPQEVEKPTLLERLSVNLKKKIA